MKPEPLTSILRWINIVLARRRARRAEPVHATTLGRQRGVDG
jgi:hypothetical protein